MSFVVIHTSGPTTDNKGKYRATDYAHAWDTLIHSVCVPHLCTGSYLSWHKHNHLRQILLGADGK